MVGLDLLEARGIVIDEVHLVDRHDDLRNADQVRDIGVAARLRRMPLRASIRMMAKLAVDAPVTMLRVYCS